MNRIIIPLSLTVTVLFVGSGCRSFLKPSESHRRASFARFERYLQVDKQEALRKVYLVFSFDGTDPSPTFDHESQQLTFAPESPLTVGQGMAVGIKPDGYLLTAAHVPGTNSHVLGWFNGRLDLRAVHSIYKHPNPDTDLAVITVEARLNHHAEFGEPLQTNEVVFAAVCYRNDPSSKIELNFAAGKVKSLHRDRSDQPITLINSTIPCWQGDSGGPLFTSDGDLVGITTGYRFEWRFFSWNYYRFAVIPDRPFIEKAIAQDRAERNLIRPQRPLQ